MYLESNREIFYLILFQRERTFVVGISLTWCHYEGCLWWSFLNFGIAFACSGEFNEFVLNWTITSNNGNKYPCKLLESHLNNSLSLY